MLEACMSPHFTEKQNGSLEKLIVLYKARIEARQCERSNQICLVMEKGHKDIHVRSLAIPEVDCVIICREQELWALTHCQRHPIPRDPEPTE